MYTVVRQTRVAATRARVFAHLSEPALLGRWLADCERFAAGEPFRLSFGDGDYFDGRVITLRADDEVRLTWRFMGIGPCFEITFHLTPLPDGATEVSVIDRGALSVEEAHSLREGWADFLARLARAVETGRTVRYRWSESFGAGIVLDDGVSWPQELEQVEWWRRAFPAAEVSFERPAQGTLVATFHDPAWAQERTQARVTAAPLGSGTYLSVVHGGFETLPETNQVAERRRYAEDWRDALGALERRHARPAEVTR